MKHMRSSENSVGIGRRTSGAPVGSSIHSNTNSTELGAGVSSSIQTRAQHSSEPDPLACVVMGNRRYLPQMSQSAVPDHLLQPEVRGQRVYGKWMSLCRNRGTDPACLNTSPNGDYQQVKGTDGSPTGDRMDRGGHKGHKSPESKGPHGHRQSVSDGKDHLPIND